MEKDRRKKLYEVGMYLSIAFFIGTAIGIWLFHAAFKESIMQLCISEAGFFWWWNLVRLEETRAARRLRR